MTGVPQTTSGFARSGDTRIHYRVTGAGDQTVVLVNGVGDDPAFYPRDPGRVAELVAGAQQSTQPATAFAAQMAALVDHDCTGRIGGVTVPALVLAASDDIIIRPELSRELFELMPESSRTWSVVPGGHAAFWEDPEPWNRAVIEFVRANSTGSQTAGVADSTG